MRPLLSDTLDLLLDVLSHRGILTSNTDSTASVTEISRVVISTLNEDIFYHRLHCLTVRVIIHYMASNLTQHGDES